jgi:hypothetical protein
MINRETITPKFFTATFVAVLPFTALFVFLASPVNAEKKVNLAYVSDGPRSSAAYWVGKDAGNAKAKDFVDLRFVDQLKKSGFIDKLYGRSHASPN